MKATQMYRKSFLLASVVAFSSTLTYAQAGGGMGQQQQSQQSTAGTMGKTNQAGTTDTSTQDKDFLKEALQGGMAEVQLGQLAAEKGSSDDVKQFGAKMVTDHTKMGDDMKPYAEHLGVMPPKDLSKKDQKLMAKLQGLSGEQFDNAYIVAMVKDHKQDHDDFTAEEARTQDPQLQQMVKQGDEIIQTHLQAIQGIAKSHNLVNDKGKLVSGQ